MNTKAHLEAVLLATLHEFELDLPAPVDLPTMDGKVYQTIYQLYWKGISLTFLVRGDIVIYVDGPEDSFQTNSVHSAEGLRYQLSHLLGSFAS